MMSQAVALCMHNVANICAYIVCILSNNDCMKRVIKNVARSYDSEAGEPIYVLRRYNPPPPPVRSHALLRHKMFAGNGLKWFRQPVCLRFIHCLTLALSTKPSIRGGCVNENNVSLSVQWFEVIFTSSIITSAKVNLKQKYVFLSS